MELGRNGFNVLGGSAVLTVVILADDRLGLVSDRVDISGVEASVAVVNTLVLVVGEILSVVDCITAVKEYGNKLGLYTASVSMKTKLCTGTDSLIAYYTSVRLTESYS